MKPVTESERFRLAVEAGADITQALVRDDAPTTIARRVAEVLDAWECDLYEYDPETRTLTATAIWARELTERDESWVGTDVSLDDRPGYRPIIEEGACVLSSVDDPGLDAADRAAMLDWGEIAALAVPLHFRDKGIVGCLTLIEKREGRRFTDEDCELVTLLAGPAAVAVRNARLFRLQQEQNRYLSSMLDTARAITSTVTLEDSLAQICRTAAGVLDAGECVAYEYDAARDSIAFRAFYGRDGQPAALDEAGVYALDDYPADRELLTAARYCRRRCPTRTSLRTCVTPWSSGARRPASTSRSSSKVSRWASWWSSRRRASGSSPPPNSELARALGEQAATAIRHARLYRRGERQNRRLVALLETSRVLVSSLDAGAVLGEVRREVADLFDVPGDEVTLLVRRGEAFVRFEPGPAVAGSDDGPAAVELDDLHRRAVAGLAPAIAAAADGSRLVVPFVSGGAAEGLLDVRTGAGLVSDDDEVELLQILASQAAAALANATLYRTLERQAITDGLTGLYNHRYFYERLNQEVARAQRYGLPLSLLMIDIDDFKHFNDRFGHPAGDLVLTEVGRILGSNLRAGIDIAARYGGEEFTIVLPNTARDGAHVVGARLARRLSALPGAPPPNDEGAETVSERIRVSVAGSSLPGMGDDTRITVSIGVACFPGAAGGPGELVRNADKALYVAKRLGKNRVEVFGD